MSKTYRYNKCTECLWRVNRPLSLHESRQLLAMVIKNIKLSAIERNDDATLKSLSGKPEEVAERILGISTKKGAWQ